MQLFELFENMVIYLHGVGDRSSCSWLKQCSEPDSLIYIDVCLHWSKKTLLILLTPNRRRQFLALKQSRVNATVLNLLDRNHINALIITLKKSAPAIFHNTILLTTCAMSSDDGVSTVSNVLRKKASSTAGDPDNSPSGKATISFFLNEGWIKPRAFKDKNSPKINASTFLSGLQITGPVYQWHHSTIKLGRPLLVGH